MSVTINYCKQVESVVLLWWAGMGAIFFSCIGFTFDPNARMMTHEISDIPYTNWIAYVGISFLGMIGYLCMTKSLKLVDPTVVGFIRSLEIIFGYIFQVAVMKEIPTVMSLIGSGLVLFSVLAISLQDILMRRIPENIQYLF